MDRLQIYVFQTGQKKIIWSDLELKKEDYISFDENEEKYAAVVIKSFKNLNNFKNLNFKLSFENNNEEKEDENNDKENINLNGNILNIKKLTDDEKDSFLQNRLNNINLYQKIEKDIEKDGIEIILKDVKTNYLNNKIIISYISEDRVDFREFVKKIAKIYKKKIEMIQLSPIDEIRLNGGFGKCGRKLCCISILSKPINTSIKMAKNQDLALNKDNISGRCGKLMCCLSYEEDAYLDKKDKLPKVGERVSIEEGEGEVVLVEALKEVLKIKLEDKESGEYYFKKIKFKEVKK